MSANNGTANGFIDPGQVAHAKTIRRLALGNPVAKKVLLGLPAKPFDWSGLANLLSNTPDITRRPTLVRHWIENQSHLPADAAALLRRSFVQAAADDNDEADEDQAEDEEPGGPKPFTFGVIDSKTFFSTTYDLVWLIRRILVRLQPCVIGGPKKTLKTTLLIDLAISLATAMRFLGEFAVDRPMRVGFFSGESGPATIKDGALRVCQSKGIDPADLGNIYWGFGLPQLNQDDHLAELERVIREHNLEVVILDPLYLCLLSGSAGRRLDASNLFDMGPLLARVTETCLRAGGTPLMAHHFRKNRESPHDTPELEDLAFAGIQEFARQWILVGRREKFEPGSGIHKLWLTVGGSAGHSGDWALDIDEGVMDDDFRGRRWDVTVRKASELREETVKQAEERVVNRKVVQARVRDEAKTLHCQEFADKAFTKLRELGKATEKNWRIAMTCNPDRIAFARQRLLDQNRIRTTTVVVRSGKSGVRSVEGWETVAETFFPEDPDAPF